MSTDPKLKNYNAVMIMKNEKSDELVPRERIPVHERDLEFQQKDLFWAFFDGDQNYIYPFDQETMKKRDAFLKSCYQIGFTSVVTLASQNFIFFRYIKTQPGVSNPVKLALLVGTNLVPIMAFSYQGLTQYNKINDYLYEKYLKK